MMAANVDNIIEYVLKMNFFDCIMYVSGVVVLWFGLSVLTVGEVFGAMRGFFRNVRVVGTPKTSRKVRINGNLFIVRENNENIGSVNIHSHPWSSQRVNRINEPPQVRRQFNENNANISHIFSADADKAATRFRSSR